MRFPNKDLYRLLRISRTATQQEIKQSYLQIALTLHPDRHAPASAAAAAASGTDDNNNEMKTEEFKKVSEAYGILRDRSLRSQYDQWLDSGGAGDSNKSRAAARNPFYRKVYSPAAPPGMKTFDRQRHYDMHYGDGMMNEAIERARKRAQAASSRHPGLFSSSHHIHNHGHSSSSYQSPLGAGFTFDRNRPKHEQINPYSIRGKRMRQQQEQKSQQQSHSRTDDPVDDDDDDDAAPTNNNDDDDDDHGDFRILYEEAHINMNGGWSSSSPRGGGGGGGGFSGMERMRGGKEYVVERMKNRRKYRVRERGDPNPYYSHHRRNHHVNNVDNRGGGDVGKKFNNNKYDVDSVASGCVVM